MKPSAAVGLFAVAFGFAVVFQRGLAGVFDMGYVFVTAVGALALVQGLRFANEARFVDERAAETEDVEDRYEVPAPGDDADDLLARSRGFSRTSVKRRRQFHRRLHEVARETLLTRGDYGEETAETALAEGTWTDDPVAAWFLGEGSPPPAVRVRQFLGSDVAFRFAATRTVAALALVRDPDAERAAVPGSTRGSVLSSVGAAGSRIGTAGSRLGTAGSRALGRLSERLREDRR